MISLSVRNMAGEEVGTYELDPADIAPGINKQLLHDVVVMYEANRRVGSVRTKSRSEVAGSTKKLYRQKGTGRARAGARRTPIRRGGGHTFAKRPKDWSYRLPRKAVRLATRMALLSKFQDDEAVVLDSLAVDEIRTKPMAKMLADLGLAGDSCLLALEEPDENVWRSARNIKGVEVRPCRELNAYDLLHQKRLVITSGALDRLREQNNGATAESSTATA